MDAPIRSGRGSPLTGGFREEKLGLAGEGVAEAAAEEGFGGGWDYRGIRRGVGGIMFPFVTMGVPIGTLGSGFRHLASSSQHAGRALDQALFALIPSDITGAAAEKPCPSLSCTRQTLQFAPLCGRVIQQISNLRGDMPSRGTTILAGFSDDVKWTKTGPKTY